MALFVGWLAFGELGIALTFTRGAGSPTTLVITRLTSAAVGLVGAWVAVQLWRRRPAALRWLPFLFEGFTAAFVGVLLCTVPARELSGVWAPAAVGILLFALWGWWLMRRLERRMADASAVGHQR